MTSLKRFEVRHLHPRRWSEDTHVLMASLVSIGIIAALVLGAAMIPAPKTASPTASAGNSPANAGNK